MAIESGKGLLGRQWFKRQLYRAIFDCSPDGLVVEHSWFALHDLIDHLDLHKIGLFSAMVPDSYDINIRVAGRELRVRKESYDRIFTCELFEPPVAAEQLNPLILRNHYGILLRKEATRSVGIDPNRETAFIALNGRPTEFEKLSKVNF